MQHDAVDEECHPLGLKVIGSFLLWYPCKPAGLVHQDQCEHFAAMSAEGYHHIVEDGTGFVTVHGAYPIGPVTLGRHRW